jgi:hypothetical protein
MTRIGSPIGAGLGHLPDGKGLGPLSPTCPANPDGKGWGPIPQPVRRRPTRPVNRRARPSRSAMLARRSAPDFGGRFAGSQRRRGVGAEREGSQAWASRRKNGAKSRGLRTPEGRARSGRNVRPPRPTAFSIRRSAQQRTIRRPAAAHQTPPDRPAHLGHLRPTALHPRAPVVPSRLPPDHPGCASPLRPTAPHARAPAPGAAADSHPDSGRMLKH